MLEHNFNKMKIWLNAMIYGLQTQLILVNYRDYTLGN